MSGDEFRVDGVPLPTNEFGQLLNPALDLPSSSVLSGVFSDGTPFAFSASDRDYLLPGTLRLNSQTVIRPAYPHLEPRALQGLLPGQQLTLRAGDVVSENFTAGWGSELTIAGGEVGDNFEAVGAAVSLSEGTIGDDADVLVGAVLNVTGGSIGEDLEIHSGGVANIAGGVIDRATIGAGGLMSLSGGSLASYVTLERGGELHVFGSEFLFRNQPIEGLEPGGSMALDLDATSLGYYLVPSLSGKLADGSDFSLYFDSWAGHPNPNLPDGGKRTLRLTSVVADLSVPEPSTLFLATFALATAAQQRRKRPR